MDGAVESASLLVVDDNPLVVNVLRSLFMAQRYQVFSSQNGKEALQLLKQKCVDVIICDVMMPKMDGYRFHEAVRNVTEYAHIPFVFLTSLSESEQVRRGKEIGADDYLVKPFNPEELLAVVKGKVRRSKALQTLSEDKYDQYRRRVIHTLSHEFRTPLVAINTGTELLIDQGGRLDADKVKNLLHAVRRGGQRLEHLVNDFMLLQQIEAGVARRLFETRGRVEAVAPFVKDVLDEEESEFTAQGFTVRFEDLSQGAKACMFAPQVTDILSRLLTNAMKFTLNEKTIEVVVLKDHDTCRIEIRDRGIGLNPARVKEAVDVFGQLDREKLEQQGGGLGLAIASRYAAVHGGEIEFERRSGGGSTVTLCLPVVVANA